MRFQDVTETVTELIPQGGDRGRDSFLKCKRRRFQDVTETVTECENEDAVEMPAVRLHNQSPSTPHIPGKQKHEVSKL